MRLKKQIYKPKKNTIIDLWLQSIGNMNIVLQEKRLQ